RLAARSVEGQPGEAPGGQLLRRLQAQQTQAAERVWTTVGQAVRAVGQVLDPAEDLPAAFKVVDRLIKEGGDRGRLPRSTSQEPYDMPRQGVGPGAIEPSRRLSRKIAEGTGPGALWDVLEDPQPQLSALHHYATVTSDILSGMTASLATVS